MANNHEPLLRVEHLKQYFKMGRQVNRAVDDVSFEIRKGEVFGLVGESGCGKTTTGRTIINLYDPTGGNIYFQGQRISCCDKGTRMLLSDEKRRAKKEIERIRKETAGKISEEPARRAELEAQRDQRIQKIQKDLAELRATALKDLAESREDMKNRDKIYRERRKAELNAEYGAKIADAEARLANAQGEEKAAIAAEIEDLRNHQKNEQEMLKKDTVLTRMQMIFQDPIASINPRMTVREIIAEGLIIRGIKDKKFIDDKVYEMLELVGLVREHADRYPHEFSGGQRQRIGIARAIVMEPDLIIADEPISALDVSIQAQVINLLNDLRDQMGLTILFIAHNLSVVKYFSDRIGVMYFGKIVELATSEELFKNPLHPYTKSLLSAIPYPDPHYEKQRKRIVYNPVLAHDYSVDKPSLREITPGHFIHCNDAEFAKYQEEMQ